MFDLIVVNWFLLKDGFDERQKRSQNGLQLNIRS